MSTADSMRDYTPTTEQVRVDYVMAYTDRASSQLLAERARVARMLPGVAVPVIARGHNLLRVTDDGTDPKACVPFAVDEVTS